MAEKKQPRKIRYTDYELSLIKNTFSDNEDVLRLLRKVFLQFPLDVIDRSVIEKVRANRELLAVIRKSFLPTLDVDSPLHQIIDLWMTVDIKEKSVEQAELNLVARKKLIDYLEQQLKYLESKTPEKVLFDSFIKFNAKNSKATVSNFIMRNTLINHVEMILSQFILLAGQKDETVEQTKERLYRDSTK